MGKKRATPTSTGKPRIIVITGTTGSGKSAWMRAIRFCLLFEAALERSGKRHIEQSMVFDDIEIIRSATKDRKGNKVKDTLTIIEEDGTKQVWPGPFHRKIPDEFIERTGIFNLDIPDLKSKLCLNFFSQHDRAMSRDFKPSEISKIFGSVSGRNKIDSAIRETNTAIKRMKVGRDQFKELIKQSEEALEDEEKALPAAPPDVEDIVKEYEAIQKIERRSAYIDASEAHIQKLEEICTELDDRIDGLETDTESIESQISEYKDLLRINRAIPNIVEVDLKGVANACTGGEAIEVLMNEVANLVSWDSVACKLEGEMDTYKLNVSINERAQIDIQKELKKLLKDGICPFSGEKLPTDCKTALIS
jgi:DNA repair exonuclease SbcCD ATPase subunit